MSESLGQIKDFRFQQIGQPTKTERRILALEAAKKLERFWTPLSVYRDFLQFKRNSRSGSHDCQCGRRISRTREHCSNCLTYRMGRALGLNLLNAAA